jgi:hypothetical protein
MTARMRHCWFCGDELGMIEDRNYERTDTCGKLECNRETREAARADRDEAHEQLDRDWGW